MYAIIQAKDKQYKVSEGEKLIVEKIKDDVNAQINFEQVLLVSKDGGACAVGAPFVSGVSVSATVIKHFRGDKIIVFKKKRRKNYRKKQGHKQHYTLLQINKING